MVKLFPRPSLAARPSVCTDVRARDNAPNAYHLAQHALLHLAGCSLLPTSPDLDLLLWSKCRESGAGFGGR